jgi:hypothetical protein
MRRLHLGHLLQVQGGVCDSDMLHVLYWIMHAHALHANRRGGVGMGSVCQGQGIWGPRLCNLILPAVDKPPHGGCLTGVWLIFD